MSPNIGCHAAFADARRRRDRRRRWYTGCYKSRVQTASKVNWRSLALAGLLLPASYGLVHLGPTGMPVAEGCSGTGAIQPGTDVRASFAVPLASEQPVPVGTDGFFVVDGAVKGLSAEAAVATLVVEVKTSDGQPVPGSLELIDEQNGSLLAGWTASNALVVGTKLHAEFRVTEETSGPAPGEVQLEVVGPPASLPSAPELVLAGFIDFGHGVGEPTPCGVQVGGSCNFNTIPAEVPGSEERRVAVDAWWREPGVSSIVAWKVHVVAQSPRPGSIPPTYTPYYLYGSAESEVGRLVFANEPEDYCATLVVTDLRTGRESRASKCQPHQAPTSVAADYPLYQCSMAPNGELEPRWCALRFAWALPNAGTFNWATADRVALRLPTTQITRARLVRPKVVTSRALPRLGRGARWRCCSQSHCWARGVDAKAA